MSQWVNSIFKQGKVHLLFSLHWLIFRVFIYVKQTLTLNLDPMVNHRLTKRPCEWCSSRGADTKPTLDLFVFEVCMHWYLFH
jgi:hypothetical protein